MTLLTVINAYLAHTRMPPTKFGRLAVNDPRLVHDLRRGRLPRSAMVARVEAFIRDHPGRSSGPIHTRVAPPQPSLNMGRKSATFATFRRSAPVRDARRGGEDQA